MSYLMYAMNNMPNSFQRNMDHLISGELEEQYTGDIDFTTAIMSDRWETIGSSWSGAQRKMARGSNDQDS